MLKKFIVAIVFVCVSLPHVSFAIPGFIKERMGTISGQVMFEGKPLPKILVSFFDVTKGLPPIPGYEGRIPDEILLTDDDGKFAQKLLPGDYYIGALIRVTEPRLGPPREGEPLYFGQDGKGGLLKLAIQDRQKIDYGQIDCVLPNTFSETEDSFRVEGTVLKEAQGKKPFSGAMILAKTSKSQFKRPEYVSAKTGSDGKFALTLRPGPIYYLLARASITGQRPQAGENIGRYSNDQGTDVNTNNDQGAGPPPGVAEDQPFRTLNNEELPVSGESGQVLSGIIIYMYDMPETGPDAQKPAQQELRREAGLPRFAEGVSLKVLFATNSHIVDNQSFKELDEWARFLKGDSRLLIQLNGHTDNVGNAEYNMELSRKRASSVAQYLIDKGLDSRRVKVTGYGSTVPVFDNTTEENRHKNRRVEIKFIR